MHTRPQLIQFTFIVFNSAYKINNLMGEDEGGEHRLLKGDWTEKYRDSSPLLTSVARIQRGDTKHRCETKTESICS